MRTNSTLIVVIRIVAFILLCLYSLLVFGQQEIAQNKALPAAVKLAVAEPAVSSFDGVDQDEKIRLHWTLTDDNKISSVLIEKSYTGDAFQYVADFWVNLDGDATKNFKYADSKKGNKAVYYRLKITGADGQVQYSNVLFFAPRKVNK